MKWLDELRGDRPPGATEAAWIRARLKARWNLWLGARWLRFGRRLHERRMRRLRARLFRQQMEGKTFGGPLVSSSNVDGNYPLDAGTPSASAEDRKAPVRQENEENEHGQSAGTQRVKTGHSDQESEGQESGYDDPHDSQPTPQGWAG